ncbi:hypothetical protein [Nitrosococcus wardiae]|uniref:Uncharacterized protein n=1 Tax=Nitrosococcus wardiae TaxID=1814290 RepID=A0A4P7C091_9GAMM|nr:hypothetical protein [Nitrosococcus wardiae]QBQ54232.1 hypothetical protein E3U44_06725 [Nitrosococcus wardiae]
MAIITIRDLNESRTLDPQERAAIRGGWLWGWIVPYRQGSQRGFPLQVNQYFRVNQYFADQIQIVNQNQVVSIIDSAGANVSLDEDSINTINLPAA